MKRIIVSLIFGLMGGIIFSLSLRNSWAFDSPKIIIKIGAFVCCALSFIVVFFIFYIYWPNKNQKKEINSG